MLLSPSEHGHVTIFSRQHACTVGELPPPPPPSLSSYPPCPGLIAAAQVHCHEAYASHDGKK